MLTLLNELQHRKKQETTPIVAVVRFFKQRHPVRRFFSLLNYIKDRVNVNLSMET